MSTQEAAFRLVVGLAGDGFESKCSRELCRAELACWYVASRQQTKSIFKVLYSGFGVRAARENVCERHSAKGTTLNSENEMTKPLLVPKIHCPTVRYNCQQECTTLFFLPSSFSARFISVSFILIWDFYKIAANLSKFMHKCHLINRFHFYPIRFEARSFGPLMIPLPCAKTSRDLGIKWSMLTDWSTSYGVFSSLVNHIVMNTFLSKECLVTWQHLSLVPVWLNPFSDSPGCFSVVRIVHFVDWIGSQLHH